jgi:hypothetical protein
MGSWAYSRNVGINSGLNYYGFQLDNWLGNRGPLNTDSTNILNLAGVVRLPRHMELGLNFSYSSVPPLSAYVGGIDFNGDGTTSDLLPGTTADAFNRGMGRTDLERLVAQFNSTYAGTNDALGTRIRPLTLPARYSLGDNFHSLDLRLSRSFVFRERWRLSLIGEVFNFYNKANLTGYTGDLTSPAFGQPTSRANQNFGSGGPRAFQLAMRVRFERRTRQHDPNLLNISASRSASGQRRLKSSWRNLEYEKRWPSQCATRSDCLDDRPGNSVYTLRTQQ